MEFQSTNFGTTYGDGGSGGEYGEQWGQEVATVGPDGGQVHGGANHSTLHARGPHAHHGGQSQGQQWGAPPQQTAPQPGQQQQQWGDASYGAGGGDMNWGGELQGAFNAMGGGNTMAGIGLATQMMGIGGQNQKEVLEKNIGKYRAWLGFLKIYFKVTNVYVLQKLTVLMFPFKHNHTRLVDTSGYEVAEEYKYAAPTDDVNGMDLYIPSMALVSYVLISAAIMGATKSFTPEVLGSQTSWCIAVCILEVIALQILCLTFQASSKLFIIDSICMSGYKYVGICVCLVARFLLPWPFWLAPMLWCWACTAFMMRSQLGEHFMESADFGGQRSTAKRAVPVLIAAAAWQPFVYLFLVSNVIGDAPVPVPQPS